VEIDFTRFSVRVRGVEVDLTPTEYKILTLLVKRAGEPVPPQQLLRRVWGPEYNSEDLVKWHVGHLRRKIELNPENRSSSSHAVASDTFTPDRPLSPSLTQMPALLAITIFGLFVGAISNLAIERTPPIEGLVPPSLRNGVSLRVQFRRVVVTVLAALLFALAWSRFGDSPIEFAAVAAFGTVFLVLAFVDLETLYLPDVIIYPAFIVALAVLPFRSDLAIWQGALGAVVGLAVFFPFAWIGDRIGRDIMGWSDVKFSALLGIVLGIQLLLLGLYLGILIGGVVGIGALLARGLGARRTLIPYGPSLAVGGLIALYAGSAITDWASRTL
jgi:prepilin signal peptidase PulO-like enzyme (type II secretory pathway)